MLRKLFSTIIGVLLPLLVSAQLTIIVDEIPDNTPEGDPIHIAGDFQGWNPASDTHKLIKDTILNIHLIRLPSSPGNFQFKFTRGSWEKVESDENGSYIPNRNFSSSDGDTLRLQIMGWEDLDGNGGGISTAAENVTVITDSFHIPQYDRYRRVWLYLPPDYESSGKNYPVLYMHDGQNVFDNLTSYMGEWEVDETLNALHEKRDPGIIVVAVDNGLARRTEEYTPWINLTYGNGGGGSAYIDFIVNNLKPFIDNNYRTLADRENTGIMGSSLGGLISTYGGIKYQNVFSKVGAFSPAYWFNPELFNFVSSVGKIENMRIFQITGSLEGTDYVNNMFNMEDTLVAAGFSRDEITTIEKTDGEHSEWFWAREFEAAYLWLFRNGASNIENGTIIGGDIHLYPNPTGESIRLDFSLLESDEVRIDIIDSKGSNNKLIYANTLHPGHHSLKFNIKNHDLSPGFYFCRIQTDVTVRSLKFVIVR